jgi:hypothetical protein
VLGVEGLRAVLVGPVVHQVVPPQVAALGPGHFGAGAPDDEDVLDARGMPGGLVGERLHRLRPAAAVLAVGGDQEAGLGVLDAGLEGGR